MSPRTPEKKVEFTPGVSPERLKGQYQAYADELRANEAEEQAAHVARQAALAANNHGIEGITHKPQSPSPQNFEPIQTDNDMDILDIEAALAGEDFINASSGLPVEAENSKPSNALISKSDILAPRDRAGFTRRNARTHDTPVGMEELKGLNILVVEDIMVNQEVLRSLLEPVGCIVSTATDGQAAIDIMGAQRFDVVLMDIRMPGMNGIDATESIRQTPGPHQNVAIIALTADVSAETNAQCLAAGADVYLTKPVIVSELFASIRFARKMKTEQIVRQGDGLTEKHPRISLTLPGRQISLRV